MQTNNDPKFETTLAEVVYRQAELDKNYWQAREGLTKELESQRAVLFAKLMDAERRLVAESVVCY